MASALENFEDTKRATLFSQDLRSTTNHKRLVPMTEQWKCRNLEDSPRDLKPEQMALRKKTLGIIADIFKRHGAFAIETPVFELKETLTGKYGEESKRIYHLADQGGGFGLLRYDLTVLFAQYLAINKVESMKRYHIGRVYQRDNPAKGRYREFYQCDLDIAGQTTNPMVPDFEVVKVLTELLDELEIGDYEVKLNHRKLLDGMLQICGVPQEKFSTICSAIDKLDKLPWDQVRKEMVEETGLTDDIADQIGGLVQKRGSPLVLLEDLRQVDSPFSKDKGSVAAFEELDVLFEYLEASKCIDRVVFDLSLARGLDYYTGVIFEATLKGSFQVGSIAAGGRYDDLVGMFSGKQVPAVGVSLGIERVFAIKENQEMEKQEKDRQRANQTEVLVAVLGTDKRTGSKIAIEIASNLWKGGVKAEFGCVVPGKFSQQIIRAAKEGIPWLVYTDEDEVNKGIVKLKDIPAKKDVELTKESLVLDLKDELGL